MKYLRLDYGSHVLVRNVNYQRNINYVLNMNLGWRQN